MNKLRLAPPYPHIAPPQKCILGECVFHLRGHVGPCGSNCLSEWPNPLLSCSSGKLIFTPSHRHFNYLIVVCARLAFLYDL